MGPSERAGAHSQDYHRCLELHPMMSLFLWIGANFSSALHSVSCLATVVVIWERCLSFVQAVCAFTNCAGGQLGMGCCLCGSFSRVSTIWVGGYCPCEGSDILVLSLQQRMLSLNILSILSAPSKIICSCNAMVQKYRWVNSANTNSTFFVVELPILRYTLMIWGRW